MCTIIILNDVFVGYPLVIASNRDERISRKSRPPELIQHGDCKFIRPWDDEKEGTWLGIAQGGWFVGLTNQDDGKHDQHMLTRGKIVMDCLHAGFHAGAAAVLKNIDPTKYNPFNLVLGRPGAMFLVRVMPGKDIEMEPIPQGIAVVSNDCWGSRYDFKLNWALASVSNFMSSVKTIDELICNLHTVLSDHTCISPNDPFQALCVHAPAYEFETRSTSIITVSNSKTVEYWYTEGPPCQKLKPELACRLVNHHE